tara:strand:- start:849 stop:1835 length:987 start_codon:yes stop_codon:yes gene_type:complete
VNKKPIIIIAGEPYSIFFEILFKVYKSNFLNKFKFPLIVIGSEQIIKKQMKKMGYNLIINIIKEKEILSSKIYKNKINLIDVDFKEKKTFDKISSKSNNYIKNCFSIGLNLMKKKIGLGIINGPISKKYFLNKKFNGITEFISSKTGSKDKEVMLIYNKNLSVVPITTHIPLKNVSKAITTKKIIYKIQTINKFYKKNFKKFPRFAVTGLNPHCETTSKLSEEKSIIIPAIRKLKKKKINVLGPISADTSFLKNNLKKIDIIIGMYHDQVLTPIKALHEFDAINVTVGLKFIRISPDHGTNNQMLGKNKSSELSLKKSLNFFNEIDAN